MEICLYSDFIVFILNLLIKGYSTLETGTALELFLISNWKNYTLFIKRLNWTKQKYESSFSSNFSIKSFVFGVALISWTHIRTFVMIHVQPSFRVVHVSGGILSSVWSNLFYFLLSVDLSSTLYLNIPHTPSLALVLSRWSIRPFCFLYVYACLKHTISPFRVWSEFPIFPPPYFLVSRFDCIENIASYIFHENIHFMY